MKIILKGGVYLDTSADGRVAPRHVFFGGEFKSWGSYVAVAPFTIEVEGDVDTLPVEIEALEKRRRELTGQYDAMVNVIDGHIANLQALTNEVKS